MALTMGTAVLLVDDDTADTTMALNVLRRLTASDTVTVCHDGFEALAAIFSQDGTVDPLILQSLKVVILDLKMPRLDGFEVLRRFKSDDRTRSIPIVIFSSSNELTDIARSYQLGANSFVTKPVNADEFDRILSLAGTYWLNMNNVAHVSAVSDAIAH